MTTDRSSAKFAAVLLVALFLAGVGCGCSHPPEPVHPEESEPEAPEVIVTEPVPEGGANGPLVTMPPPPPASTASYEQAMSAPEPLDANDTRVHLTDVQLTNPMREVMSKCRLPRKAKVVAKVAVQRGRAIGVTVLVNFDRPKPPARPPTMAALRYEAKVKKKVVECIDHSVRDLSWPPSSRRDSFTTEF